jgi:pimeloyl-ACP methyl ester carboxylesterase
VSDDFESLDLGGRALRYICDGEGTPTVVVEQGQGISVERGFSFPSAVGWARVFMEVQKTTRICMHDRAGLGSSDQAEAPRASVQMVEDLRTLLQKARIKPPYVLVGQSIGGFNARLFAARYPQEVVGMVLVDSSHPDQRVRFSEFLPPESADEPRTVRLLRHGLDPSATPEGIDFRKSADQVRAAPSLGLMPLVVLSQSPNALRPPGFPADIWDKMRTTWAGLQADLLNLSGNSSQIVATHSGHLIQLEEPQLVIDAILKVVHQARSGKISLH